MANKHQRISSRNSRNRSSARHTRVGRTSARTQRAYTARTRRSVQQARVAGTVSSNAPTMRGGSPSSLDKGVFTIPNSELVVTRRHFLYGAIGVGAIAAASTVAAASGVFNNDEADITILSVPSSSVITSDALSDVELDSCFGLVGNFEIPYGSLVWCNDDDVAACLIPGEAAKPLTQIQILHLGSGNTETVVEQAVGQSEGFEIYDVRATSAGIIWTEADILEGQWRIYTAKFSTSGALGTPVLVDQGDANWETPTLTMVNSCAFWQVMPRSDGNAASQDSALKKATVGSTQVDVVYTSSGRMATPPSATKAGVTITPRTDTSTVHYQLTYLDAHSGDILDTLVLPQSMKPLDVGYGKTGFMFCFEGIYDYGDGIANLGSYVPQKSATGDGYSSVPWFRWTRTPVCAPCWCDDYLIVKSTQTVCAIDMAALTYGPTEVATGSDDYGDYLASTGENSQFVTFANVYNKPINEAEEKYCLVRVWQPL